MTPHDPVAEPVPTAFGPVALTQEGPPDGPPIVLVHGVPGSVRDFRYLGPRLATWARVVRVDLPGWGATPAPPGYRPDLPGRARAVSAAAEALGLRDWTVLGHSMGGGVAMYVAAAGGPRRLVLLNSVGLRPHKALGGLGPWSFTTLGALLHVPGVSGPLQARMRELYRKARFPGAERMGVPELHWILRHAAGVDFPALARLAPTLKLPTLVLWAEDDHLVEPEIARALASTLPSASGLPFREGGHNLQKTHAEAVAEAVRGFVTGRSGAP